MNLQELRKKLTDRLSELGRKIEFDRRTEKLSVTDSVSGHQMTLVLPDILQKYSSEGEQAIDACVQLTNQTFEDMNRALHIGGNEAKIFPVIRAASFPDQAADGKTLISSPHTAETKIFYALDLGQSGRLIDDSVLQLEGIERQDLIEQAMTNLQALPVRFKKDVVKNNAFYFINSNDGYDASRILNKRLLREMQKRARGELAVAVPHQDVLIFADLVNPEGYNILAQMMMKFYASAPVPITLLPFLYKGGQLEPIFILAKKRPHPLGPEK
ncbi:MAG: DUF1444 family protein [Sporolactobacillus sp.]